MFVFIKKLLNKHKAKKLLLIIDKIETELTLFKIIEIDNAQAKKITKSISSISDYDDVISRYNVYTQKADVHNQKIRSLTFAINSLIQTYPSKKIIDNILDYNKSTIEEIYETIKEVYAYVIPNSHTGKQEYDSYKRDIEDILSNFELIQEQKNLIVSICEQFSKLPDKYIDEEDLKSLSVFKKTEEYNLYPVKYYSVPVIDKETINEHNERFIQHHINDPIFDNINGKSLDEEQRRAVLCDAKSNLTIAGAGSGKTLTICGKVKYLVETGLAKKEDILLLSYSKASAIDLEKKIKAIYPEVAVETFHALGLKVINESSNKKQIIEEQLKSHITTFFKEEIVNNPTIADDLIQYISLYFYSASVNTKKHKNEGEIYEELKSRDFQTLKDELRKLSLDPFKRETIKKEYVKSNEELVIANYLFINGINYEYEKPYKIKTDSSKKRQYTPDFYLPDYDIYIEHYGIDRSGKTPQYDKEASDEYVRSMEWKRKTHLENNTKCIETYSYEFNEGVLFDNLKHRLIENGVQIKPMSQLAIFNTLHNIYNDRDFSSFLNLLMTFISLYKSQMQDDTGFETLKNQLRGTKREITRATLFLDICKSVYNYYMHSLREAEKIDFDDMIIKAIDLLDHTPNFKYKYVIVDEFQDISRSRTRFLQKLVEHGNAKLFAVGDDWQAIYRFAGCDINVFLEFEKIFPGAKLNYITSTHRNSDELQKIVEPFITANPNQYKKHIKSSKHQDKPVRIIYHKGNKAMALSKALDDIYRINNNANVLVLGRNRHDIDCFVCKEISVNNYQTITHTDYQTLRLSYSTIHGSKGLESDFVVLISGEDAPNGFPNKTEDDPLLSLLLGKKGSYEYEEERRLFYVALTRTKSIVYILSEKNKSSTFIKEIKNNCFIVDDASDENNDSDILCPWCKSGHLIIRHAEVDGKSFYGCSNFPYCKYTNNDIKSVYNNKKCPRCGDFLVLRSGKHGRFYGCYNYPRCTYKRNLDE